MPACEQEIGVGERRLEEPVRRPVQLALGKGPELQEDCPASERLRDRRHSQKVRGAVEEELPAAGVVVHDVLDRSDQRLSRPLDLVEGPWCLPEGREPGRIVQRSAQRRLPVEARERAGVTQRPPHQRGLACLTGTGDDDHSEAGECFSGDRLQTPRQLVHLVAPASIDSYVRSLLRVSSYLYR